MDETQPGQVIAPGATNAQPTPQSMLQEPMPANLQTTVMQPMPAPQSAEISDLPQQALSGSRGDVPEADAALSWTAAEYHHSDKSSTWYGAYTLGTIILAVVLYLLTKDVMSTAVVCVAVLGLVVFAGRKPREQQYAFDGDYLWVGQRAYGLHDFKAFSLDEQGPVLGISLLPLKRFMPPIVLYVDETHEQAAVDYLAAYLPMEPHKVDAVDSLLRRMRF